jgi:hypothetical protein
MTEIEKIIQAIQAEKIKRNNPKQPEIRCCYRMGIVRRNIIETNQVPKRVRIGSGRPIFITGKRLIIKADRTIDIHLR